MGQTYQGHWNYNMMAEYYQTLQRVLKRNIIENQTGNGFYSILKLYFCLEIPISLKIQRYKM